MTALDCIEAKKTERKLSEEQIRFFVEGVSQGSIPDYQAAALLMAICCRGMDEEETAWLTLAMAESGRRVDLSAIDGVAVDKHSTGGVGDTTTLVAAPLAAACGVPVAKMSGRGLGYTGGTLDKLESIPGVRVNFSEDEWVAMVRRVGLAIIGQSDDLTPADKKLYALRDVTATVDSIGLITASIMSKKLASGCNAVVLDVKTGSGAFMKTKEDGEKLANLMMAMGEHAGMKTVALRSDMNQPLGRAVGNALEVQEAVDILSGAVQSGRLRTLSIEIAAHMVVLGNMCKTFDEALRLVGRALVHGAGMEKLEEMVRQQGGEPNALQRLGEITGRCRKLEIQAQQSGKIAAMDTQRLGRAACLLGAGRERKEDLIHPGVGFRMEAELGDWVKKGQPLAVFWVASQSRLEEATVCFQEGITISEE